MLDGKTWKLKGLWSKQSVKYGYDFWYQYKDNTLISTEWGKPSSWWKGFDPSLLKSGMNCELMATIVSHFKPYTSSFTVLVLDHCGSVGRVVSLSVKN